MCAYHTVCDETKWIELNDYSRKYPAPRKLVMECMCVGGGGALTAIYFRNKKKNLYHWFTCDILLSPRGKEGGDPNT